MLDTDVASYLIKGPSEVDRHVKTVAAELLCISVMTRAELLYGLKRLPSGHRLQLLVSRFLAQVRVLSWDEAAADHYADIRHDLTFTGQGIGILDMMIAAHAQSVGAILVTNNIRHFSRVAGLPLANWADPTSKDG